MKSTPPTVVITAGGTGGHVFPALAVAKELKARGIAVHWIGTQQGLEATLVPESEIPISYIVVQGLRGHRGRRLIRAPWMIARAIWQCRTILKQQQAQCVLGMGGYVTGPVGIAARLTGRPLVIHEQNAIAGTTNKILAKFAQQVLQAFPSAFEASEKVICTGNPVRAEIATLPEPLARFSSHVGPLRILVLGGSLGAKVLNEWLPQVFSQLPEYMQLQIRHQSGAAHFEQTEQAYKQNHVADFEVVRFIQDMSGALAWADLVIARAGALTVSELAAAGVGALLIPFPYAVDDHQTANAQYLFQRGAALVCAQSSLSVQLLADRLSELLQQGRDNLLNMAQHARELAQPHATAEVADICQRWIRNG